MKHSTNYNPTLPPYTLDRAALLKLKKIFEEDPMAYSRELGIISEAIDSQPPETRINKLKIQELT